MIYFTQTQRTTQVRNRKREIANRRSGKRSEVAYDEYKVVGVIGVSPEYSDWWGTQYWWIVSLYTAPSYRRQGVARSLLEYVRKVSIEHKVQSLSLRVEVQNVNAQRLYKKVGFAIDNSHYVMTVGRTPGGTNITA